MYYFQEYFIQCKNQKKLHRFTKTCFILAKNSILHTSCFQIAIDIKTVLIGHVLNNKYDK